MPDPVRSLLTRLGMLEHEDEFRSFLLQYDAQSTPAALAAAVVCLLMLRSGVARSVVTLVSRQLFGLPVELMVDENVVVMDGSHLYCPSADGAGRIYRLPSMEVVAAADMPQPILTSVFSVGRSLAICQEVVGT